MDIAATVLTTGWLIQTVLKSTSRICCRPMSKGQIYTSLHTGDRCCLMTNIWSSERNTNNLCREFADADMKEEVEQQHLQIVLRCSFGGNCLTLSRSNGSKASSRCVARRPRLFCSGGSSQPKRTKECLNSQGHVGGIFAPLTGTARLLDRREPTTGSGQELGTKEWSE